MAPQYKSIETKHHEERESLFRDLQRLGRLSRRGFMRVAGAAAGIVAAKGLVTPHGFQLVDSARRAGASARRGPGAIHLCVHLRHAYVHAERQ